MAVPRLEVKRKFDLQDVADVTELFRVAEAHDGHRPVGEHAWLDLVDGGRRGFAGLVAWEEGHDHPVAYAQVSRGDAHATWALEYVIDPHHRAHAVAIGTDLVGSALKVVAEEGGGHVHLWVNKPVDAHDVIAEAVGLRRGRDLLQMRRDLPVTEAYEIATRPFVVGQDETAWLEVNNRAFLQHPEQGGWDLDTLKQRQSEPWFDPAGFLLHDREGRLAGFCWTKGHDDHDPPLGEIYVVAVDPDFHGQGLGRALVLAGLDYLDNAGYRIGMLYVDAHNDGAIKLYLDLGFTVDHADRAYTGDVVPTPTSEPTA